MHIKALFVRHDRACFWDSWHTMPFEYRLGESFAVFVLAAFGFLFAAVANSAEGGLSSFAFLLWAVPSIVMTPFIIWRIMIRMCPEHGSMCYGNFVRHNSYIDSSRFTPLHIMLYLLKAYCPLLNAVCVLLGVISIARCDFSVSCARLSLRRR